MGKALSLGGLVGLIAGHHSGSAGQHSYTAAPGSSAGPSLLGNTSPGTAPLALPNTGPAGNSGKTLLGQ